ncbi:MAG: XRE family transcriptional regulator [Rubrivivax sp.]|nr:MAG: XRE family transcriptional regulator [Rubrivivax sp.]
MPAKSPELLMTAQRLLETLGRLIRARRKVLGISAIAAAESAGMSRVTWHRIEKGEGSVAASAYANAIHVLDMGEELGTEGRHTGVQPTALEGWLPARIAVADYPELRKLAWQVSDREQLSPREALSIYERNLRHLDESALIPGERALIEALRVALAGDV